MRSDFSLNSNSHSDEELMLSQQKVHSEFIVSRNYCVPMAFTAESPPLQGQ